MSSTNRQPDPAPDDFDVERLLGIKVTVRRTAKGPELQLAECPYCGKDAKGVASFNPVVGFFNCLRCSKAGGWRMLMKDFGQPIFRDKSPLLRQRPTAPVTHVSGVTVAQKAVADSSGSLVYRAREVLRAMQERLWGEEGDPVRAYFHGRGITDEALKHYGVGCTVEGEMVFPFFKPDGTFRRSKTRDPKDKTKMRYLVDTARDEAPNPEAGLHLWGIQKLEKDADYVVIVEGEIDALTLCSMGIPNVVAVPGANLWKSFQIRAFSSATIVYVAVDNDDEGNALADRIEGDVKIGRYVRIKFGDWKDANDALIKGKWTSQQFMDRIFDSRPGRVEGAGSLRAYAERLFQKDRHALTRWPAVNHAMGEGLRRGEMTVVTGITGHGKSLVSMDLTLGMVLEQEIPTLYVTLEVDEKQLVAALACMLSGKEWGSLKHDKELLLESINRVVGAPLYFVRRDPANSLASVIAAIEHSVVNLGVDVVIVDPLQWLVRPCKEYDIFQQMASVSEAFSNLAKKHGAHIFVVAHQSQVGSKKRASMWGIKYGTTLAQDSDNCWVVHRMPEAFGRKRCEIEMAKVRHIEGRSGAVVKMEQIGMRWCEEASVPVSPAPVAGSGDVSLPYSE